MAITGDNDYDVRVYRWGDDATPDLQRALHAELCRHGEVNLHSTFLAMPACARALSVVQRAHAEGVLVVGMRSS